MPRYILPQPVSRRELQTSCSQPGTGLDVGNSVIHRPRKRSFSQFDRGSEQFLDTFKGRLLGVEDGLLLAVHPRHQKWDPPQAHCESNKDVNKFKGRLLGVEDGMIDAIVSEPHPGHRTRQGALGSPNNSTWYSQAKVGMPERQLVRSTKRNCDALALPTDRFSKASPSSSAFQKPVLLSSNQHLDSNNHKRCSIVDDYTAAHPVFRSCTIDSHCNSVGNDNSDSDGQHAKCIWKPSDLEIATAVYSTPSVPYVWSSSPSTCEPDLPEAIDTPTDLDEIIVDTKTLEKPSNGPSLGTWDLSNWQTLEFTISDLLVARE